jgi:flagellar basal-body rod protein FlgC
MIQSVATAVSAIEAASRRMEAVASNVANAESAGALDDTRTTDTKPTYAPVRVEQTYVPGDEGRPGTVAARVRDDGSEARPAWRPGHSAADSQGVVALPDVDMVRELAEMARAELDARANAKSMRTLQETVKRLFELP